MVKSRNPLLSLDVAGPGVGETFLVKRYNSENSTEGNLVATVVDIRECDYEEVKRNREEKIQRGLAPKPTNGDGPSTESEPGTSGSGDGRALSDAETKTHRLYYIHYQGMDRRMDEWVERERFVQRTMADGSSVPSTSTPLSGSVSAEHAPLTRNQRRINEEFNHVQPAFTVMDATTALLEKEHEERTKVRNIERVRFGKFDIRSWYYSPYPRSEGEPENIARLYVCEFCLVYTSDVQRFRCHVLHECTRRQPPGDEVYCKGSVSVYEVCGSTNKTYCQCLCLLSKLFMDHKTLYFDVDTFVFYVLCEVDEKGAHLVGHFSKERGSENNLACIMVLPPYQRKGYGKLLIQLSYEMSTREGWIGTPEKPLSDLGKVSYRGYWWWVLLEVMDAMKIEDITVSLDVRDLSRHSGIHPDDIISTLQTVQMVKYWKGDQVVRTSRRLIDYCKAQGLGKPPILKLDTSCLRWNPVHVRGEIELPTPRGSHD